MKTPIKLPDGSKIVITNLHAVGVVCVEKFNPSGSLFTSFHVPAASVHEFAAVMLDAAAKIKTGPCAVVPA